MANSYQDQLNAANPQNVADLLREMLIGSVIAALPQELHLRSAAVDAYNLATVVVVKLPDTMKAASIVRANARTGTVPGEFTPQVFGTTPATTQCAVTPSGDLAFLGTDAPAGIDVLYIPEAGSVLEITLPVVTNVLTIPAALTARGAKMLTEAEALVGTAVGKKIPLVPGAGAPAAGQARLNVAKTTVTFAGADAVTSARVKLLLAPTSDLATRLQASAKY